MTTSNLNTRDALLKSLADELFGVENGKVLVAKDISIFGLVYTLYKKGNVLTADVTGSSGKDIEIIIPETIKYKENDYKVERINNSAFCLNTKTEIISIPSGVENIEKHTFERCTSLRKISVSENNKKYCSNFEGVLFSKDRKSLLVYPAGKKDSTYVIPNDVEKISDGAFYGNMNLRYADMSDSVVLIGDQAFYNCSELISIRVSSKITVIGNNAFMGCTSLRHVEIPASAELIGDAAFCGCSSLLMINVSPGNKSYFSYNGILYDKLRKSLKVYPSGRTDEGFYVPEYVSVIEKHAFYKCDFLKSVYIDEHVTEIEKQAFYRCVSLENINVSLNNRRYRSDHGILYNSTLTELILYPAEKKYDTFTLPDKTVKIAENAFSSSKYLKSVILPESVRIIEDYAFFNCSGLRYVSLSRKTEIIGDYAFGYCVHLKNVAIPGSVSRIGEFAFECCFEMRCVSILKGVTKISKSAFLYCRSLTDISIPRSVTSIESAAFCGCLNLINIYYEGSKLEWSQINTDNSYSGNKSLISAGKHCA